MKNQFRKRMDKAFEECPGVVMGHMPGNEHATGEIIVDPVCSKVALDFLKRRFHVEERDIIDQTGELRFVITPRTRRAPGKPAVRYQKPFQYELPL